MSSLIDLVARYEDLGDDALYSALGAALEGSGLGISPQERSRFARFARQWFANKSTQLRRRVQETETYQIWAATAGPGQVAEASIVASAFHEQGHDDETAAALGVVVVRDELARSCHTYDIAVSFAASQATYVGAVVTAARERGLEVFHAPDMTHQWWGRNFVHEQRKVYGQLTLHFVPFISPDYFVEPRSRDAFDTAMVTAMQRGDDYILPVLAGDATAPAEMLNPHIVCLRADENHPETLATHMQTKVAASKQQHQQPRDLGTIVRDAHSSANTPITD